MTGTDDGSGHLVLSGASSFVVNDSAGAEAVGLTVSSNVSVNPSLTNPATAGTVVLISGSSSFTASVTASESLSSIEAAINTATSGAVTATDDGSGHLVLSSSSAFTINNSRHPIARHHFGQRR